jgi:hypothetical protein
MSTTLLLKLVTLFYKCGAIDTLKIERAVYNLILVCFFSSRSLSANPICYWLFQIREQNAAGLDCIDRE